MIGGTIMATKKGSKKPASDTAAYRVSSPVEELMLAALERGDESFETGRYLVTFKEGAVEEGLQSLGPQGHGMRVADARDFDGQAATLESVGDADAVVFPEIGVALVSGEAAQARSMSVATEIAADSPVESIDPEYFVFAADDYGRYRQGAFAQPAENTPNEYLRGFLRAVETIVKDLQAGAQPQLEPE